MHFSYTALAAFIAGALAAPAPAAHTLHEKREILPERWTKGERLDGSLFVPVRIGLTQSNLEEGHDRLMEVSTPGSPKYGRYYSEEEIHDMFAPSEVSVESVRAWLRDHGIDPARVSQSFNKQWIQLDAKIAELESLLKTKYHMYTHESGRKNVACEEYYVPEHVTEHVDYITPGIKLHAMGGKKRSDLEKRTFGFGNTSPLPPLKAPLPLPLSVLEDNPLALSTCGVAITPACLRAEYGFPIGKKAAPGNQLGIFEDLGDKYAQEDLDLFFASLFPRIAQGTHPQLKGIDGATAPAAVTAAGPESDLDFEISYPIIYPQGSVLFQTDDDVYEANYTFEGFLNNFLDAIDGSYCTYAAFGEKGNSPLDPPYPDPQAGGYKGKLQCGVYKPTNVISISYGGQEADLPMNYQRRQCNEYMKLGMRGISILVASGDSGVAGPSGDDSANGCLGGGKIFSPDFPATCPYLTTVGGTVLPPGADPTQDMETAVTRFPSGGGFSNIYPIPSYQKTAVQNYFANHAPSYPYYNSVYNSSFGANGGIYNRAGRGYPDVSAVGDNVVIFNMGAPTLIGGTSAAAPVFASILNRINEERIAAGKSTVGFVNPTLYAHPGILNDVTKGSNPGCGTNGFSCAKGWDPVTGLGTPNYPKMLKVFMAQ